MQTVLCGKTDRFCALLSSGTVPSLPALSIPLSSGEGKQCDATAEQRTAHADSDEAAVDDSFETQCHLISLKYKAIDRGDGVPSRGQCM